MRNLILIIFVGTATLVWAGENMPEPKETQVLELDADRAKKEYKSKNYTIKEETDIVEQALSVFKKKGRPSSLYRKRIWIYATPEEENASFLSFMTNDQNQNIVFSPDEEFVYYIEISSSGRRRLKGVKIGSEEEFFINTADRFFIETCENKQTSYIITIDGGEIEGYYVYDLQGQPIALPNMPADVNDLKNVICY